MTTQTTERTFRSALVGWCSKCRLYTEPLEGDCPFDCWTPAFNTKRQVKRRVLICSACASCSFTRQEAEEHDCDDYFI